jgi:hypothetical protein
MLQLDLFKGTRQRGDAPPAPTEFQLQCAIARLLRVSCNPHWIWSALPFGEKRDPATAGRLQAMGVNAGLPDMVFFGPNRAVLFLELKRPSQAMRASEIQKAVAAHLMACGHAYLMTNDYGQVVETLRDLGIVRASVSV